MQVFVKEVGVWMDSFDPSQHFRQITPYHALKSPVLINACLACGVQHQSTGSQVMNDRALSYYNTKDLGIASVAIQERAGRGRTDVGRDRTQERPATWERRKETEGGLGVG